MWNNIWLRAATLALLALAASGSLMAQVSETAPKLLLTPQRLRRLQRDKERQTVRWTDFENRVESVPDSPERGFELALYYAVTHDAERGREAIQWADRHCESRRQVALIADWVGDLISNDKRDVLTHRDCISGAKIAEFSTTSELFAQVAAGDNPEDMISRTKTGLLELLKSGGFQNARTLYAACEYLMVVRATEREDLREDARQFFYNLPQEFLLSLRPEQIEHPDWMTHVAALALVNVDPNLEGSQYLQGWAMENAQTIHEGPGVAYEFLWGDPYLPGVGYQNLDPWVYDASGRLFARTDWEPNACWISVSKVIAEENCPPGWQKSSKIFGHMTLMPMSASCVEAPPRKTVNDVNVFWKLAPHQTVYFLIDKQLESMQADAAGMWRLPANVAGKACTSPDTLKVPRARK